MNLLSEACITFEKLVATSSRLEKEAILQELKAKPGMNEFLKEYFSIALDCNRCFGIGQLPEITCNGKNDATWQDFLVLTQKLESNSVDDVAKETAYRLLRRYNSLVSKWLQRTLLKDLRMGVSYGLTNKLWPGLIKVFDCMKATTCADWSKIKFPVAAEPKMDGLRAICLPIKSHRQLTSRGGKEFYHVQHIIDEFNRQGFMDIPDGELYADNLDDTKKVVMRSKTKPDPDCFKKLKYYVFDHLYVTEWRDQQSGRGYLERRQQLPMPDMFSKEASKSLIVKTHMIIVHNLAELEEVSRRFVEMGYEGAVIKGLESPYEWDYSKYWLKHVPPEPGDFEVIDQYPGSGRNAKRLGGLVLQLANGKTCKCGGGFSDKLREEYWKNPLTGQIVEVKYKMLTPDGMLREPVFKRVREDKVIGNQPRKEVSKMTNPTPAAPAPAPVVEIGTVPAVKAVMTKRGWTWEKAVRATVTVDEEKCKEITAFIKGGYKKKESWEGMEQDDTRIAKFINIVIGLVQLLA